MKKLVFALYVFGIIIMFPLYAVLEISHGETKAFEDNLSNDVIDSVEKGRLQEFEKVKVSKSKLIDSGASGHYNIMGNTAFFVSLKHSV